MLSLLSKDTVRKLFERDDLSEMEAFTGSLRAFVKGTLCGKNEASSG